MTQEAGMEQNEATPVATGAVEAQQKTVLRQLAAMA